MSDIELDNLHTGLCQTLSGAGEQCSPLLLARVALLVMGAIALAVSA